MRPANTLPVLLALALALGGASTLRAQEEQPLQAGGEGVPVPKKTKHVQPVYPQEALAQGVRGIVILDLVIDARGKVASTSVLRSVPGLDEAAIAAARQWEYEPTKLDGKPVSVRLTVPITFTLALPRLQRQAGVPELRQGATPVFPKDASGGGSASAEVTLESDGRVGSARLLAGESPWSEALLAALKTWRFGMPPEDSVLTFRVEADFVKGKGNDPNGVELRATGLQRSDLLADASKPAAATPPPTPPAPAPQAPPPATAATPPAAKPTPTPAPAPPAAPSAAAPSPTTPSPAPTPTPAPARPAAPLAGPPAPGPAKPAATAPATTAAPGAAPDSAPPPIEVITAPPPPPPQENGVSAVREVTLEPGVPDLARGRRPVVPPVARLSGTTGTVEVLFSVSAGGVTALQTATGPDMLRYSAEQTVASWVFARKNAERAYLIATFTYGPDKGAAVIRPQQQPAAPAKPPAPEAPPAAAPPSAPPAQQ